MGILETEFHRLHWPPLVREVVHTVTHPGYRYEFFRSFRELDAYFRMAVSKEWQKEAWAEFWINQHLETKNDDRKEHSARNKITPLAKTGNRRDIQQIQNACFEYLDQCAGKVSSRGLVSYLATLHIHTTPMTTWRMIKRWRNAPDEPMMNKDTGVYMSSAYLQNVVTPLGTQIPEGYTREQWRADWKKKHNLE